MLSIPDTADYKVYVTVWPPAVLHVVWWDASSELGLKFYKFVTGPEDHRAGATGHRYM